MPKDPPKDLLAHSGISLDRLRNFCIVAEKGGIAKAVGDDLSRQALFSRQIRELEGFFGIELTRRRGKGIEITEGGLELGRLIRLALVGLEDFKARAEQKPVELRLAAGNSVLEWFLIPRLAKLAQSLRGIKVRLLDLQSAETISGLKEHSVDIGVVRNSAVSEPLKYLQIAEIGYCLFVPPSMAGRGPKLSNYPLALARGGEFFEQTMRRADEAGVKPDIRWHCTSFAQATRLVQAGVCAAILPDMAAPHLSETAVPVDLPWLRSYRRKIGFAWHQRQVEARPAVGEILELLCRAPTK